MGLYGKWSAGMEMSDGKEENHQVITDSYYLGVMNLSEVIRGDKK